MFEEVLDTTGVTAGTRLLDAGCGAGLALSLAAARGAFVTGLDASPPLLAIAAERVSGNDIHHGDLEDLPFDDGSFDVVTAFNSVQYAADPVQALLELRRVAVPGAPVALTTWAVPQKCESRVVFQALGSLLPPPPPGGGGPFALSEPGRLEELVSRAGLTPDRAQDVSVVFLFATLDQAVEAHLSAGPPQRAVEVVGREAVVDALEAALADSIQPDGSSRHENAFRYLIATA